jgi:hypothetical protein
MTPIVMVLNILVMKPVIALVTLHPIYFRVTFWFRGENILFFLGVLFDL